MSRLVMLPNARHVPEFRPVSSTGNVSTCRAAYGVCPGHDKLLSKGPEAGYLAAVRGIITRPRSVAQIRRTSASDHRLELTTPAENLALGQWGRGGRVNGAIGISV